MALLISCQLQGLADALDGAVSHQRLLEFQMFPELIKASCTMFGAWGPAIAQCTGLSLCFCLYCGC